MGGEFVERLDTFPVHFHSDECAYNPEEMAKPRFRSCIIEKGALVFKPLIFNIAVKKTKEGKVRSKL